MPLSTGIVTKGKSLFDRILRILKTDIYAMTDN